jgi:predicted 3-demethylubiquinone-9 3-methyltransferase (glyoxalase superfamily)
MIKQKIVPHLWFDKEAVEAAEFYTSIFTGSKITHKSIIMNTPSGDCDIVGFELSGHLFMSISAGPLFKINPSISFIIGCYTREEVDTYFEHLSPGGEVLMPLDKYPFSERYAWVQDKYGISWQLILTSPEGDERPKIIPTLLFTGGIYGKAEEAVDFYLSLFKDSKLGNRIHYGPNQEPNEEGKIMFSDFRLEDTWLAAMDGGGEHKFNFNEAISFIINCKDQEEIDYFWEKLSAVPESEQCGWLKDRYGVSWQIIPENMNELMSRNPEKTTPVMLEMKKIIIAALKKAGENL